MASPQPPAVSPHLPAPPAGAATVPQPPTACWVDPACWLPLPAPAFSSPVCVGVHCWNLGGPGSHLSVLQALCGALIVASPQPSTARCADSMLAPLALVLPCGALIVASPPPSAVQCVPSACTPGAGAGASAGAGAGAGADAPTATGAGAAVASAVAARVIHAGCVMCLPLPNGCAAGVGAWAFVCQGVALGTGVPCSACCACSCSFACCSCVCCSGNLARASACTSAGGSADWIHLPSWNTIQPVGLTE